MEQIDQKEKIQQFLNSEFGWQMTAGECNFLIQLLAHVVQTNPEIVRNSEGKSERLNYQSIRTIVLLNEKLSGQLQKYAQEASLGMGEVSGQSETVQ